MPVLSPVVARASEDAAALRVRRASSLENEKRALRLPGVMQEVFKLKDRLRALFRSAGTQGSKSKRFRVRDRNNLRQNRHLRTVQVTCKTGNEQEEQRAGQVTCKGT